METPFDISLSFEEEGIAREYQDKLRTFGLDFIFSTQENNMQLDEKNDEQNAKDYLRVTHVPTCFILRFENEKKYNRSFSMVNITTTLVREIIDKIKSTRGGGLGILPKTISDILSSRACRGKFLLHLIKWYRLCLYETILGCPPHNPCQLKLCKIKMTTQIIYYFLVICNLRCNQIW